MNFKKTASFLEKWEKYEGYDLLEVCLKGNYHWLIHAVQSFVSLGTRAPFKPVLLCFHRKKWRTCLQPSLLRHRTAWASMCWMNIVRMSLLHSYLYCAGGKETRLQQGMRLDIIDPPKEMIVLSPLLLLIFISSSAFLIVFSVSSGFNFQDFKDVDFTSLECEWLMALFV